MNRRVKTRFPHLMCSRESKFQVGAFQLAICSPTGQMGKTHDGPCMVMHIRCILVQ